MWFLQSPRSRRFLSTILGSLWLGLNHVLAVTTIPGDLNDDFDTTVADIAILVSHIQGTQFLEPEAIPYVDFDLNGVLNSVDVEVLVAMVMDSQGPQVIPTAAIKETLPQRGESNVGVKRETILYFTLPLAEDAVISNDNLFALFGGEKLLTRIEVSSDRLKATLFYLDPLPDNSRVRVIFDGAGIKDILGRDFDPDQDGEPGGLYGLDFNTVSITELPGTAISGTVYQSRKNELDNDVPLAGVVIEVVGAEETIRTTTAGDGSFTLDPCPGGRFFVNVDGRPVTGQFPTGDYYPFVGKAWYAKPGRTDNLVNEDGKIYLPLIMAGTLKTVSQTDITVVEFPQAVLDENPALSGVRVTVPANSLFNEEGTRGGMVGIAPVAPDRIPEPLPDGLQASLVITVQTDGPANFDRPAPVVFPNLPNPETGEILPPGSKSALWSFNHDTGIWEIGGPMTVSADGLTVVSDPGVGIRQPGWHIITPGSPTCCGGPGPNPGPRPKPRPGPDPGPDPDPDPDDDDEKDCKEQAALALSGLVQAQLATGLAIPKSLPFGVGQGIGAAVNGLGAQVDSMIAPEKSGDFWEGAAKNTAISTATFVPNPYVSGTATYLGLLDTWSSFGERLGDLAGCAAPLPLSFNPPLITPFSDTVQAKSEVIQALDIVVQSFDEFTYPVLAKLPRYLEIQFNLLQASNDFYSAFYGSDIWLRQGLNQNDAVTGYLQFIFEKLVDDFFIGETEKNLILNSALRPPDLTDNDVNSLIDLLNERSTNGFTEADFNALKSSAQAIQTNLESIQNETPYDHPYFFWNNYLPSLWLELFPPPPDPPIITSRSSGPGDGGGGGGGGGGIDGATTYTVSNQPYPAEHYYKLVNINEQSVRRGRTNKLGQLDNLILAPNSTFYITYYIVEKNEISLAIFRTPSAGVRTRIPISPSFEVDSSEPDQDGDRVPDIAEDIVGTDPDNADSDGDGVLDGAELLQDSDPLDDQPAAIGLLADVTASGSLVDLAVKDDLLFAAMTTVSTNRMAIYDISSGFDPITISDYAIEGANTSEAIQIAVQGDLVCLALQEDGLLLLDIRDPAAPVEFKRVLFRKASVTSVVMDGNFIFAGLSDGRIATIDALSGIPFSSIQVDNTSSDVTILDLALSNGYLYANTREKIYTFARKAGAFLEQTSVYTNQNPFISSTGKLFLGNGILMAIHGRGYSALNLSNPAEPTLEVDYDLGQFGWKEITLNGSGLMIAAAGPLTGASSTDIYDVSITGFSSSYLQTINTQGFTQSMILNNGLAYAGGNLSLGVVNYLAPDNGDTPPTITLTSELGATVNEGVQIPVAVVAFDDVQIRNVEFYANNVLASTDGNYPFTGKIQAPLLEEGSDILTLYAIAYDTAGNSTQSETLLITVVEDLSPPEILGSTPFRESFNSEVERMSIFPSESLAKETVDSSSFFLTFSGPDFKLDTLDDSFVNGGEILFSNTSAGVYLRFGEVLQPGIYRITVTTDVTDSSGNPLANTFSSTFTVFGINEADSDGDGIPDEIEESLGYNPLEVDSDGDGTLDGEEDFDQDGVTNLIEVILGSDLNDTDSDNDTLTDFEEFELGTDPTSTDTDQDGLRDDKEVDEGLNPLEIDTDGDLLDDSTEFWNGYDAGTPDTSLEHTLSAQVIIYYKAGSSEPENLGALSQPVAQENQ